MVDWSSVNNTQASRWVWPEPHPSILARLHVAPMRPQWKARMGSSCMNSCAGIWNGWYSIDCCLIFHNWYRMACLGLDSETSAVFLLPFKFSLLLHSSRWLFFHAWFRCIPTLNLRIIGNRQIVASNVLWFTMCPTGLVCRSVKPCVVFQIDLERSLKVPSCQKGMT